ncbi:thioredoxin family protein [Chitinophaga sp.]|uniref:thioredoxin family protein n=1 Tax=Chitinophaga sp. TaxID=1869181 RepID=UPI0031D4DE6F
MMKQLIYFILFIHAFFPLTAQNREIAFEHDALSTLLERAGREHKLVFVDCYTTWCGPCKAMAATVFKQDTVADFFNSQLISLKIDMEKGEGPDMAKKYRILAYPSYLLLNEKGEMVYKFIGAMPAKEFLKRVSEGMDPGNRIASVFRRYEAGDRSPGLMREYIVLSLANREVKQGNLLNEEYMRSLTAKEKLLPENWFLFGENKYARDLSDMHSPNFNYLVEHWKEFAAAKGLDSVNSKISAVFFNLTSYCLRGYYQKNIGYKKDDFGIYRKQIKNTRVPDKKDLLVMMDMAEAACLRDTMRVTNLLADHITSFSSPNINIVFDYLSLVPSFKRKAFPRWEEIMKDAATYSKNTFLVNHVKTYF